MELLAFIFTIISIAIIGIYYNIKEIKDENKRRNRKLPLQNNPDNIDDSQFYIFDGFKVTKTKL
jgi:predicted membrane protein